MIFRGNHCFIEMDITIGLLFMYLLAFSEGAAWLCLNKGSLQVSENPMALVREELDKRHKQVSWKTNKKIHTAEPQFIHKSTFISEIIKKLQVFAGTSS